MKTPSFDSGGDVTRVLVLVNENSPIIHALLFLRKRGYKIKVIHRLMDTIQELVAHEPDVLLISWNLKRTDVRKAYKLLSEKFSTLCVVFSDDNTPKASASLMASGIPHTLLPPVSGPGMHMRIQALLRKRRIRQNEKRLSTAATKIFTEDYTPPNTFESDDFDFSEQRKKSKNPFQDDMSSAPSPTVDPLANPISDDYNLVPSEEIPENTQWSPFQSSNNPEDNVWQGVAEKDGKKSFYYFRGPSEPTFDKDGKAWGGFGKVDIMQTQEKDPEKINEYLDNNKSLSSKLGGFDSDDLSGGKSKGQNTFGKELEDELKNIITEDETTIETKRKIGKNIVTQTEDGENKYDEKIAVQGITDFSKAQKDKEFEATTFLKMKDKKTVLAQGVHKAVASVIKPSDGSAKAIDILSKVTVTMVKTTRNQGYLVGANASDLPDHDLMEQVLEHLGDAMKDLGEPMNPTTGILELELDPLPFMLWVENKAEFFVKSKHGEDEVVYAYIPFQNMPEVVEAADTDQLIGIKHSSIFPGKPILFNVYIHMPKNNKYLLYFRKGTVIETNTLAKLIKFGVKHIYIKKSEEDLYQTYCAKYKIAESYEEFTKKKAS